MTQRSHSAARSCNSILLIRVQATVCAFPGTLTWSDPWSLVWSNYSAGPSLSPLHLTGLHVLLKCAKVLLPQDLTFSVSSPWSLTMTHTWWSPSSPPGLCSNVSLSMRSPRSLAVITKQEQWWLPHMSPPLLPFCPISLYSFYDHLACQVSSLFVYCLSFLTVNFMRAGIGFITLSILYLQYHRHIINASHVGRMNKLHESKETLL